jgi:hypothetical protein
MKTLITIILLFALSTQAQTVRIIQGSAMITTGIILMKLDPTPPASNSDYFGAKDVISGVFIAVGSVAVISGVSNKIKQRRVNMEVTPFSAKITVKINKKNVIRIK